MNRRALGVTSALYALRLALALVLGAVAGSLAAELTRGLWEHDAVLFEPGALYVSEALRLWQKPMFAVARAGIWIGLVAAYLGLLPLAAAIAALARPGPIRAGGLAQTAAGAFAKLSILLGSTLALQALAIAIFAMMATGVRAAVAARASDRTADLWGLAVAFAGAIAVVTIGTAQDLSRVRIVRDDATFLSAAADGARHLAARPLAIVGAWALRAGAGLALVLGVAWLVGGIGVKTPGRTLLVASLHQATAFLLVALRVSWLTATLAFVPPPGAPVPSNLESSNLESSNFESGE